MMESLSVIHSDPSAPMFKLFRSALGEHLLVVPHSRIYDLTGDLRFEDDKHRKVKEVIRAEEGVRALQETGEQLRQSNDAQRALLEQSTGEVARVHEQVRQARAELAALEEAQAQSRNAWEAERVELDLTMDLARESDGTCLVFGARTMKARHPAMHQAAWRSDTQGEVVPSPVMDSLEKIRAVQLEFNVSFAKLVHFAVQRERV